MPFDGHRPDHAAARHASAAPCRPRPSEAMCAVGRAFERAMMDLGFRAAQSAEVRRCMATQWFRFAMGRTEVQSDSCALQKIEKLSKRKKQALLVTLDNFLKGAGVS